MRLIDADLLTQKVKGWLNTDPNSDSIMIDANESVACVLREIEEQPTAYDVDKVVGELKRDKFIESECILSDVHQGYNAGLSRAIEIVKGGGIEW